MATYNSASNLMRTHLLPEADRLVNVNDAAFERTYQDSSGTQSVIRITFLLTTLVLLALLTTLRLYPFSRFRRMINPGAAAASALVLVVLVTGLVEISSQREQLRIARHDAFDSVVALTRARAVSYDANADESRYLLDQAGADGHERHFLVTSQQLMNLPWTTSTSLRRPAYQAPGLHDVLDRCRQEGMPHVILDGTLIESNRLAGVRDNGNDLWFSQKHKAFGGNVQFLSAPDGTPLWVSDVEPGSTPDITAARIHALPTLYKAAAADGLPTLADKGYIGAGIGIHVPVRRPKGQSEQALHADTRTINTLIRDLRALGERASAELKERRRALKHVSLSPSRIGDIARAALVLNGIWK